MTTEEAYKTLEKFIESERFWRERVFASNPDKLSVKIRECDKAIEALNALTAKAEGVGQIRLIDGN